jgi:hypothetical protein
MILLAVAVAAVATPITAGVASARIPGGGLILHGTGTGPTELAAAQVAQDNLLALAGKAGYSCTGNTFADHQLANGTWTSTVTAICQ